MIVTETSEETLIFTQSDHASLASRLLALWNEPELADHPRRSELLLAIREHDNGWQAEDAAPRLGNGGRPLGFRKMPLAIRAEIWRRGVERHRVEHPYVAALIARHAEHLHSDVRQAPAWRELGDELETLISEILEEVGVALEAFESDYGFLRLADTLSLGACGALTAREPVSGSDLGRNFELELGRIGLAPFPMAGTTRLEIAYRGLPPRSYPSAGELAAALGAAKWRRLTVRIEPTEAA